MKVLCTTTGETTSHLTKLANYANQVIGYALADAVLKNGSESGVAKRQAEMYIPVPRHFLPCLSFARNVVQRTL